MKKKDFKKPEQLELAFGTPSQPVAVLVAPPVDPVTPGPQAGSSRADASRNTAFPGRGTMKTLAETLRRELENRASCRVALTITNNTSNLMSVIVAPGGGHVKLRLHHMFLDAPEEVRNALAHWVRHPRSRKHADCFRAFIASRDHQIRKSQTVSARVNTKGAVYDLKAIFDELNAACFNSSIQAAISWGKGSSGPMRSIRFGSYYEATRLIRIHPRLDQAFVPFFVVRYIVYHEMLHAHLGVTRNKNGRRQIHPRQFKIMESSFPDYRRAVDWIENPENLHRILRGRKPKRHK